MHYYIWKNSPTLNVYYYNGPTRKIYEIMRYGGIIYGIFRFIGWNTL